MRLTVLGQQAKSVAADDVELGEAATKELERTKHFLWHGNVERAFETLHGLAFDLDMRRRSAASIAKLHRAVGEFETYLLNNREYWASPDLMDTQPGAILLPEVFDGEAKRQSEGRYGREA